MHPEVLIFRASHSALACLNVTKLLAFFQLSFFPLVMESQDETDFHLHVWSSL